jgi:dienelactone hydrolase
VVATEQLTVVSVTDPSADVELVGLLAERAVEVGLRWQAVDPEDAAAAVSAAADTGARVGVAGVGRLGREAVTAAAGDGRVAALALVGTHPTGDDVSLVKAWPELPVLAMVDAGDRDALRGSVDAYLASASGGADLFVRPLDGDAATRVTRWLGEQLRSSVSPEEVVLTTADGFTLHANRWLPERDDPVPGVVLFHSGRSDRAVFAKLERLLAEAGMAVLNVDWRGRGLSTGRGSYLELTKQEFDDRWQDGLAAFDHLASLPQVDGGRLGTVGVVQGAELAARAAQRDPRVRAVVQLTGYVPASPEEAAHLTGSGIRAYYVASAAHGPMATAMRDLHAATPPGRSTFVEYPGALLGYQLFDVDPSLEPSIVSWLAEVLQQ